MYECAHKCMGPLQYRSYIVYEMNRSYGVCLYVSTIHVYTVRHNVVCICHAQGPIGLYLRNKHSSSSSVYFYSIDDSKDGFQTVVDLEQNIILIVLFYLIIRFLHESRWSN